LFASLPSHDPTVKVYGDQDVDYMRVILFSFPSLARILLLSVFLLNVFFVSGQDKEGSYQTLNNHLYSNANSQFDLIDAWKSLRGRKIQKRADSSDVKSGKVRVSPLPTVGYTLQTGFAALLSANIAFYLSEHDHEKISSILTSVTYSEYNQIIFPIQASIWTKGNDYNVIVDWRFLEYPSKTFGLGGRSNINDGYTINFDYFKFHQSILKRVYPDLYAGLGYYFDHFTNVRQVDPPENVVTEFERYGLTKTVTASGLAFRLLYDSRYNQITPENGLYANIVYRPNFTALGSDNSWQSLLLELRKYVTLPARSKNVLALWSYNWLTIGQGKPPYLLLPSTGWDDFYNTGRGYIQGRYRGRNLIYLETEYRFNLTTNGLFGGVVFANAQSFPRQIPTRTYLVLPGWGTGLRIRLNKFSRANLCIDYGWGLEGSRGFFVNLGEVF